jgi:hypothetical protein
MVYQKTREFTIPINKIAQNQTTRGFFALFFAANLTVTTTYLPVAL